MKMYLTATSSNTLQSTSAVMVLPTQKSATFVSVFTEKQQFLVHFGFCQTLLVLRTLKLIKTTITFDNRLSDYRLTSIEIML